MKALSTIYTSVLITFFLSGIVYSQDNQNKTDSSRSSMKDALQIVLNYDGTSISKYGSTGKELLSMGNVALDRLINALDEVPLDQKGKVALAISLWGNEAYKVIPKLIEIFPLNPSVETSVSMDLFMTQNELDKEKLEIFVNQYQDSQNKVTVTSQSVELDDGTWKTTKFLVFFAPSAVVALKNITLEYAGKDQKDWIDWWEQNKNNYKTGN